MALVEVKNISYKYPNGYLAVDDVSFSIEAGENIAIVGQNGAGKTTTVKMLNGLMKPCDGDVLIDGDSTKIIPRLKWQDGSVMYSRIRTIRSLIPLFIVRLSMDSKK